MGILSLTLGGLYCRLYFTVGSEAKVDVNKKCHQGFNPFLTATMEGYRFCVSALLASKFLDLRTSWQGMSPVTIAQQNGHRKIKEMILVRSREIRAH